MMRWLLVFLVMMISLAGHTQIQEQIDSTSRTRILDCTSLIKPVYVLNNRILPCDSVQFIDVADIEEIQVIKDSETITLHGPAENRTGTVVIITKKYAARIKQSKKADKIKKP